MPLATRLSMTSQSASRARGVEPGGRFVQEQHFRLGHERSREIETPAHATRVALHGTISRLDQIELFEQFTGARLTAFAPEVVEPPDHLEVLETGEVLVDRRILPGRADPGSEHPRVVDDVETGHLRPAASGTRSVVKTRTAVVLPAPFGPSSAITVPDGTARSTPVQRCDLAVLLDQTLCRYRIDHQKFPSVGVWTPV